MGNAGSRRASSRRRRRRDIAQPEQAEASGNRFVFAAATPYPPQNRNFNYAHYYSYPSYLPPPPPPFPQQPLVPAFDQHYNAGLGGRQDTYGGYSHTPMPYIEHQKAVTIRNDVNLKKKSLRVEPDEENPGKFLVSFTFDATAPGSITVMFFAKEEVDCILTTTKETLVKPVTVLFQKGLGQKFRQPSGTGIDFSLFEEKELTKESDTEVFPLVVKAEARLLDHNESNGNLGRNSQITQAVFDKEKGEYRVHAIKQVLWVNGRRYELQEIYGSENSVDGDFDNRDSAKECVICLTEPCNTTVLPCRHMCMCSGCSKILRCRTDRCPICRQPIERLLEIKVNNDSS